MEKPRKVEETQGAYATAKDSRKKNGDGVRYAKREGVLTTNERLMKVHRAVLEKLAK